MQKNTILEKALTQYIKFGHQISPADFHKMNISLSDIAKQLEIPDQAIKEFYSNKEDLINDLFLYCIDLSLIYIKENLNEKADIKEKIDYISFKLIEWAVKNPDAFSLIQQVANSPYVNQNVMDTIFKKIDFILQIIEQGKKEKILKDSPTILLSDILFGLITRTISYFIRNEHEFHNKVHLEQAQKMIWDSIRNNVIFL